MKHWTYARWKDDKSPMLLFDNENDPFQMNNLSQHSDYQEIKKQLEVKLFERMNTTSDPFEHGKRDPETGMLYLGQNLIPWKPDCLGPKHIYDKQPIATLSPSKGDV